MFEDKARFYAQAKRIEDLRDQTDREVDTLTAMITQEIGITTGDVIEAKFSRGWVREKVPVRFVVEYISPCITRFGGVNPNLKFGGRILTKQDHPHRGGNSQSLYIGPDNQPEYKVVGRYEKGSFTPA